MSKFAVIIAAAGKGERFGGNERKTLAKLDGRPVFLRAIEAFLNRPDVCQIILAVAPEDMQQIKTQYGPNLGFMGVKLVEGGTERTGSVAAGLKALAPEAEYVAVHDAARPCVSEDTINAVFAEAVKSGAAIPAARLTGTIKRVSGTMLVEETASREGFFEAQTPQVFRKDVLVHAYERLGDRAAQVTDDAQVVEQAGGQVSVVPSSRSNLKITTSEDMTLAAAILKARPVKRAPRMGAFDEAQW